MRTFLSVFTDFVLANTSKVTLVKQAIRDSKQKNHAYNPHEDWRMVRTAIQEFLRNGSTGDELDRVIERAHPDRRARYEKWVRGFRAVRGRRQFKWIEPPKLTFNHAGLTVSCTPDLGFIDQGVRTYVKLNYSGRSPTRQRVAVIGQVMRSAMKGVPADVRFGVLDLVHSSLRTPPAKAEVAYLVKDQAETFVRYWKDHQGGASEDIA